MDLPKVVGPNDGKSGFLGSIGARFMIEGSEAANRFSLVEHPMSAHALAAPLHKHGREDEYSYVPEGSYLVTASSLASRAISSSNRATNGTRFGTQATRRLGS